MDEINKNKWRNRHVHQHFANELPSDQICVADFTCALEKKGLIRHGRLYFTQQFVCFHSPIANTKLMLHVSEIIRVVPKNTLFFPSAILVETAEESHHLMSFIFRGNALNSFAALMFAWRKATDDSASELGRESSEFASDRRLSSSSLSLDQSYAPRSVTEHKRSSKRTKRQYAVRFESHSLVLAAGAVCILLMVMNVMVLYKSASLGLLS
ncbi:hypothetical protein HDU91_000743 [Kappamyces sp. JEL0680]|nr:hypothetical protein HDU91_000743 [Kappamyces sp. JEL0680]